LPPNQANNSKEQSEIKPNTTANGTVVNTPSNTAEGSHQNDKEKATNALPNGTNATASLNTTNDAIKPAEKLATVQQSSTTDASSNPSLSSPAPKSSSSSNLKTSNISPSTLNVKAPSFKPSSSGNPPVPQRTHSAPPSLEEQQQQYGGNGMNPNVPTFNPGNSTYNFPPQFTPQKHFYNVYGYPYIPYHTASSPLYVPQIPPTGNPNIVPPAQIQNSMGPVPLGNNTGNFNTGITPANYTTRFTAPVPAPATVPVPSTTPPPSTPTKRIAIIDPATGKEVSGSSPPRPRPTGTASTTSTSTPATTATPNAQFAPTIVPTTSSTAQKSVTGPGGILPELGTMNQNKESKHPEDKPIDDKSKPVTISTDDKKPKEVPKKEEVTEHKALHFDTPEKSEKKPVIPEKEPSAPLKKPEISEKVEKPEKSEKSEKPEKPEISEKKEEVEEEDDWENKREEDLAPKPGEVKERKSSMDEVTNMKAIVYSNSTMWTPSNTNGLRVYDRLFMEQFKDLPMLKDKPDEMASMDDLMEDGEPKEKEYKERGELRREGSAQWKSQAPPGFAPRDKSDRGKMSRSESGRINKDGMQSPSSRRGGRGGRGGMQGSMNKKQSSSNLNGNMPPIAPLEKSENRWQTSREKDVTDDEAILRKTISILNKITEETFEALSVKLLRQEIKSVELLNAIIKTFFDKAVWEPKFCSLYAELCRRLSENVPDFPTDGGKPVTFKRLLLNRCQEEFETIFKAYKKDTPLDAEGNPLPQKEPTREEKLLQEEAEMLGKKRMMGNVSFIGELYKSRMLTEKIMHDCIKRLLGDLKNPSEIDMEALCRLMTSIGFDIDHAKAKAYMDQYFARMKELSKNNALSSRIRFMLQDVLILRENNWVARVIGSGVAKEVEKPEKPSKGKPKKSEGNNSEDEWELVGSGKFTGNKRPTPSMTVTAIAQPPRYQTLANNSGSGSTPLSSSPSSSDDNPILRPGNTSGLGRGAKGWSQNSGNKNQPTTAPKSVNVKLPTSQSKEKIEPVKPLPVEDNTVITDDLENKMDLIIEEYLSSNDLEEAVVCVNEILVPNGSKIQIHFVTKCLTIAMEKKDKDRISLSKLLNVLFTTNNQFHNSFFLKGLGEIMDSLEDLKIDIPQSPQYIAFFVANGLANNYLTLENITTLITPLQSEEKQTYPPTANFMGDVFHSLTSVTKESKVREIYYKNEINFNKYLASNDDSVLLNFLEDKNIASCLAPLTLELMIRMKKPIDEVVGWVEDNIGEEGFNDPSVIRRLMGFVITLILNTLSSEGNDKIKDKVKESLKNYSRLLNTFLMDNISLQVQSLFEIELVLHNLTHGTNGSKYHKELLEGVYSALYDTKLIAGKAFLIWVDAKDEHENIRKEVQSYAQSVLTAAKSSRGSNYEDEEEELEVEEQD